ncbi:MAG TPA: hypothetical protein RMH85_15060 [Polyangiaceae bacterium LLY-WYZ-15_(1-7)]|nr:hypothetical protein [Polyangiaceae bacterium LLY-WYZ-15_(1-7)]HJL04049.1 hypothetical protein [Polyangiaceae bacterium LLY-WYZ-15_(1-7)]HJL09817.1 hypothetical protein [Polyangiaceae bacterium LLY-WYZ-15_(1-7)]HJL38635.1 hypothetical protein [Polyangiaceae bacterium LLY-WYZ-15_(1-7)]
MRLGLDVGNAKVKLALDVEGETRFATHLPPYRAERRYDRAADFEEGIDAAVERVLEGRPRDGVEAAVAVTSSGYSYPSFEEGVRHTAAILARALPDARCFLLSGRAEPVATEAIGRGEAAFDQLAFTNASGAVVLARQAAFRGLVVDIGGSTAGTTVLADEGVDPAAFADPAGWLDHRLRHGKLCWIGAESTPLEMLLPEVTLGGRAYPVIPRGVPFRNVSLLLELVDPARLKRLSFFGLLPGRDLALRALADALGADRTMLSDDALLDAAHQLADAAVARLAAAFARARQTASPNARERALVFGIGAPLAERALASIGVEVERGADRWGPKPAEIASVVGALEAARRA